MARRRINVFELLKRILGLVIVSLCFAVNGRAEVQYNRDVLPILSAKCFTCHGADSASREADLRLDQRQSAIKVRTGGAAITPGDPERSLMVQRFESTDPALRMPPPEAEPLSEREQRTLRDWIAGGAAYEKHWAFLPPRITKPPRTSWGRGSIDAFVYQRLQAEGLSPQSPATPAALLRRVTFDLTGLPPTPEARDAFLFDTSPWAYERVVDRLLSSPRFGERIATWWLDGARYGDSHGYDNDLENSQWPWRNWVIDAFNQNQPFDRFTIDQLAGDLLPSATESQVLATAFHRNHRIQTEDGAIDEEWRTEYVVDRIETVGAVWLGLTLGCSRCHDHKYDPISQREFYQLFALFNNLDEKGFINNLRGSAEPRVRYRAAAYENRKREIQRRALEKDVERQRLEDLEAKHPLVMIMREMETQRATFVLERGQYDLPREQVEPALPSIFQPAAEAPRLTRLEFARWLVDGRHPLTARVLVNRLWELAFGVGLVESSENFGVRGEWPSHPELLDWLAIDLVEHGWDVKRTLRMLVLSETYRQSARVDAERLRKDPANRLLSRGPRFRLSAEMIRDQALSAAGLLNEQVGGPSVKPYQPVGLWEEVEKRGTFKQDHGPSLYRRSLYTNIRRTVPAPDLVLFDLPSRELCVIRRARTNTPLQALSLMNNVTYVEASRKLAERMMENGESPWEQISWGFSCVTTRSPNPLEQAVLFEGYKRRLSRYQDDPSLANELLKQGESPAAERWPPVQLAAMATVANVILNLDEAVNR